ncbi:MAG: SRPBCC family protein [Chloroflexi bacterium]|nr:SRPBCC family protein [Chloroflexota bacterium]
MTARTVTHATFVIERTYPASPARVFSAFADPTLKFQWFGGPAEWDRDEPELDFRVGGRETSRGGPKGGPVHAFDARYYDIVPNERIVFAYDLHLDETRISVSLATVDLKPVGKGTKLTFTEQGAFLDGWDHPEEREHGTGLLLNALGAFLERQPVSA